MGSSLFSAVTMLQLYINYPHWRLAVALRILAALLASTAITCETLILKWMPIPAGVPWWDLQSMSIGIPFVVVRIDLRAADNCKQHCSPDAIVLAFNHLGRSQPDQASRRPQAHPSWRRHRNRPFHLFFADCVYHLHDNRTSESRA